MVVHAWKGMEYASGQPYFLKAIVRPTSDGFNADDLAAFKEPLAGESLLLKIQVLKPAEPRALSRKCDVFIWTLYKDLRTMLLDHPCPEHGELLVRNMRMIFTRFGNERLLEIFCCCDLTLEWIGSSMSWINALDAQFACSQISPKDRRKYYFYGKSS
jgi:hypothetical protein